MNWKEQLKKDIVSHTTFFEGAQPSGAANIDALTKLAAKWFKWEIRQWKEMPDVMTAYMRPYLKEKVFPKMREWKRENPQITSKELRAKWKKEYNHPKEYVKFYLEKTKDRMIDKDKKS
tara:strand:- start:37 stop:393 length:357 start_codon:yes stop_codon:yes gene_type:complete